MPRQQNVEYWLQVQMEELFDLLKERFPLWHWKSYGKGGNVKGVCTLDRRLVIATGSNYALGHCWIELRWNGITIGSNHYRIEKQEVINLIAWKVIDASRERFVRYPRFKATKLARLWLQSIH